MNKLLLGGIAAALVASNMSDNTDKARMEQMEYNLSKIEEAFARFNQNMENNPSLWDNYFTILIDDIALLVDINDQTGQS